MSPQQETLEAFTRSKDQRSQELVNEYEVKDTDNIYDEISEDQFVQEQTDVHNFVVDDDIYTDGLGYNDDGENVIYGVDSNSRKAKDRNRLAPNKKNLTLEALKKKRRMTALLREDDLNQVPKGNRSMFEFLNANGNNLKEKDGENTNVGGVAETSLDDLLYNLDDPHRRVATKNRCYQKSSRFETPTRRTVVRASLYFFLHSIYHTNCLILFYCVILVIAIIL